MNRFTYNVSLSVGTNVNLTALQGSSILLGSPKVPSGNVTGIILDVTGARAFWSDGTSSQLKVVADGKLMVNTHFDIQAGGSTNLTLSISTGDIHVSQGETTVLSPVVHVTIMSGGQTNTTTDQTSESRDSSSA